MSEKNLCQQPAFVRYTWPGRDEALACLQHSQQIAWVAKGIGIHLQMIPLSEVDHLLLLTCSSQDDIPEEIKEKLGVASNDNPEK